MERERCQRIEGLILLSGKDRQTLWSDSDPGWAKRALKELGKVRLRVRVRIQDCDAIAEGYKGRRNDNRELLYAGILDLWTKHLGQKPVCSTTRGGTPCGPLIRFFSACVDPYLGDKAPTPHTIAGIVDRLA